MARRSLPSPKEKLYREEINSKSRSKTQSAKKRAKCGQNERSWCYGGQELSTMQPIAYLGAVLGGLEVLGFDSYCPFLRGEAFAVLGDEAPDARLKYGPCPRP
jgi:hypothetical protein